MNDTLRKVLYTAQRSALQVGSLAADAVQKTGDTLESAVHCAKEKARIRELRAEIQLRLQELGTLLYATHTGCPSESGALLEKMQELDALYEKLSALELAPGVPVCPHCSTVGRAGDIFCRHCGGRI